MFTNVISWNTDKLRSMATVTKKKRLYLIIYLILFGVCGGMAGYFTPNNLLNPIAKVVIVSIASLFNFIFIFAVLKVISLFLKLSISNKQISYIGIIGAIPILISNIFNIICTTLFGYSKYGYTSLNYFLHSNNFILSNLYKSLNPFIIWQFVLVSVLFISLVNIKNKYITLYVFGILLCLKVLFG